MRIGFSNGCFDLFHEGHRYFLLACRQRCDYLIVAVNTDFYCRTEKGLNRPFEPLVTRMLHVRSIAEAVVPFRGNEGKLVAEMRPDVVFRGYDQNSDQLWDLGVEVMQIGRLHGFSTTLEARRQGFDHG